MIRVFLGSYNYGLTYLGVCEVARRLVAGERVFTNIPLNLDAVGAYVEKQKKSLQVSQLILMDDAYLDACSPSSFPYNVGIVFDQAFYSGEAKNLNRIPYLSTTCRHYFQGWFFIVRDLGGVFARRVFRQAGYVYRVSEVLPRFRQGVGYEVFGGSFDYTCGFNERKMIYSPCQDFVSEICELIPSVEVKS